MAATYPFSDRKELLATEEQQTRPSQRAGSHRGDASTLLLRLGLLNLLAFGMLGAAWWEGYVATVVAADKTYLSVLIFMVFLAGLAISGWRACQINGDLNRFRLSRHDPSVALAPATRQSHQYDPATRSQTSHQGSMGALRLRLTHRISSVRHIANVLVLLGLIGTVLGFIIALSGVDPDSASDIDGIAPMVSTLITGMSTALYTTLIGSILNVWLTANYQLLSSGTVELMSLWMDAAEQQVTAADSPAHA